MLPNPTYDPVGGFAHIAIPYVGPLLMVQAMGRAPRSVAAFVAWARDRPGGANFCSIGIASPSHLAAEMFQRGTGLAMTHIPHRGSGPALTDAMAGHCDVLFDSVGSAGAQVREGRLRALAITSAARNPGWPDLPTIAEGGIAGYEAVTWSGLVAPAGTPGPVVARLNAESLTIFATPQVRAPLEAQGAVISSLSPAGFTAYLREEIARWGKVIRAGNIKPD
jgi:tripartite-type tricarboxylate transporter receptor subunit TctC